MEEIEEIWKECGVAKRCTYYVSNLGRVKSITCRSKRELILKNTLDKGGYYRVTFVVNKKKRNIPIHTLVAYVFLGPRPEGLQIDHFDRNKLNNKPDNLRYVTCSENNYNRNNYIRRKDILETDPRERQRIVEREYETKNLAIKIVCPCGITHSKRKQARHNKTKTHQNYLANLENNL